AGATAVALGAAGVWILVGKRLSERAVLNATRTLAAAFLAQVAFYAVHRSAEARLLPWGVLVDAATEPYGPDSIFGRYVSYLLVGLPVAAVVWTAMRERYARPLGWPSPVIRVQRAALVAAGMIVVACIVLAGTKARGVNMPRAS